MPGHPADRRKQRPARACLALRSSSHRRSTNRPSRPHSRTGAPPVVAAQPPHRHGALPCTVIPPHVLAHCIPATLTRNGSPRARSPGRQAYHSRASSKRQMTSLGAGSSANEGGSRAARKRPPCTATGRRATASGLCGPSRYSTYTGSHDCSEAPATLSRYRHKPGQGRTLQRAPRTRSTQGPRPLGYRWPANLHAYFEQQ